MITAISVICRDSRVGAAQAKRLVTELPPATSERGEQIG